jgi:endonuclease/exonuclease/phosphatase family metal-dependent hydrolase
MKLLTLNVQGNAHWPDRALGFLRQEQPDVVCLQEMFDFQIPQVVEELGLVEWQFLPFCRTNETLSEGSPMQPWGIFWGSRFPAHIESSHYEKHGTEVDGVYQAPEFLIGGDPAGVDRGVLVGETTDPATGEFFRIVVTHFTWSMGGIYTSEQAVSLNNLLGILDKFDELILVGDLNSPRGLEPDNVYAQLQQRYRDNIPTEVTTTLDPVFHKTRGSVSYVVDGYFTSDAYKAEQVRVVQGVSDHCGVVGMVSRR